MLGFIKSLGEPFKAILLVLAGLALMAAYASVMVFGVVAVVYYGVIMMFALPVVICWWTSRRGAC